jgi:hypothetical protein
MQSFRALRHAHFLEIRHVSSGKQFFWSTRVIIDGNLLYLCQNLVSSTQILGAKGQGRKRWVTLSLGRFKIPQILKIQDIQVCKNARAVILFSLLPQHLKTMPDKV